MSANLLANGNLRVQGALQSGPRRLQEAPGGPTGSQELGLLLRSVCRVLCCAVRQWGLDQGIGLCPACVPVSAIAWYAWAMGEVWL